MQKNIHHGPTVESYLVEDGIYDECLDLAIKAEVAAQLGRFIQDNKISKTVMASKLQTSRAQLNRLLVPDNTPVSLLTLQKAARVMGKKLEVHLV